MLTNYHAELPCYVSHTYIPRKFLSALLLALPVACAQSQAPTVATTPVDTATASSTNDTTITFVARFAKQAVTKDGYYVGPYVITLDDSLADRYDGKLVRLTGRYHVVPGLDHQPPQVDEHGDTIVMQGRAEDVGHVEVTGIELVPE